jgi:hypothetical protein
MTLGKEFKGYTNVATLRDALISSKHRKRLSQPLPTESIALQAHLEFNLDNSLEIDTNDKKVVEQVLRESLIKAFMVIFTHDHS